MDFDISNTRIEKQLQRKDYEKEYFTRNKIYGDEMVTGIDTNNKSNLIFKLKKILSKKYSLSDQEYIIIIDKFKLNSSNLNKGILIQLMAYLNEQNKYKQLDDTYVEEPVKSKTNSTMNGSINNIMDALVNNNKEFIMSKDEFKIETTPLKKKTPKKKKKKKKKKLEEKKEIPEDKTKELEQNFQERMNNYIENSKIEELIKPLPTKIKSNILTRGISQHHQIMVDLLHNGKKDNQFIVPIKNAYIYKNIQKISIRSVSISEAILSKYNLSDRSQFYIKIEELTNNFHINKSQKNYFAMIRPPSYNGGDSSQNPSCRVSYTTIYYPTNIFMLDTFSITLFNHMEEPISIMDFDESNDFIQIVFDIHTIN